MDLLEVEEDEDGEEEGDKGDAVAQQEDVDVVAPKPQNPVRLIFKLFKKYVY